MTEERLLAELRPGAFAVAYRMLGSVAEAEDVVQEGLLRLHVELAAGRRVDSPPAFLTTVVTRLAIDVLRSARVRRESYVGEWLPEPLVAAEPSGPAERAEAADSLSLALLVLLERLSPEQRAAFLLHDVFDYPHERIAEILSTSEDNARQLASRARRHVAAGRPRFEPSADRRDALADRFFAAVEDGDLAGLEALLAHDVQLHGDGGGRVPAISRPLEGRSRVARTLMAWRRTATRLGSPGVERVEVNGGPGALQRDGDGGLFAVWSLDVADGRITAIRAVVNPDKLGHLGALADITTLWPRE